MDPDPLISPQLGIRLILVFSWVLVVLGLGKLFLFPIGEYFPKAFENIKPAGLKKLVTGKGNRLVFGLGGFLTALFGAFGLLAARFLSWLLISDGSL